MPRTRCALRGPGDPVCGESVSLHPADPAPSPGGSGRGRTPRHASRAQPRRPAALTAWAAPPTLWEPCFSSWGPCCQLLKGKRRGPKVPSPRQTRPSTMTPSRLSLPSSQAPGTGGGAKGAAPPCPGRRCWSPARRPCMWQSANTWSETGAKPSRSSRPSTRRAAIAAPSSTASAMASATPSTSPGTSGRRKAPFSPAPSASPRNSPPWWLHSTAPNYSHPPRRRGSREWSSVVASPSIWTKLGHPTCPRDAALSGPRARHKTTWF